MEMILLNLYSWDPWPKVCVWDIMWDINIMMCVCAQSVLSEYGVRLVTERPTTAVLHV